MTTLIQLLAPPCMGKSTMSAGLYYRMKEAHLQVELITEPARRRVYAGLSLVGPGQLSIITDLYEHIQDVLRAEVEYVIVDTHILATLLYTKDKVAVDLAIALNKELEEQCHCVTVLLEGADGELPPYTSEGRVHKDRPSLEGIPVSDISNYIKRYKPIHWSNKPRHVITQLQYEYIERIY